MKELIAHINELNTVRALEDRFTFYVTDEARWKDLGVETVEQFNRYVLIQNFVMFAKHNNGFITRSSLADKSTEEIKQEFDNYKKTKGNNNGKL